MLKKFALPLVAALVLCGIVHAGQVELEVNVGFGPTLDVPYGQAHVYWAKILDEQSGGTIKLNVFPSDQLGSGKDIIDQAWMGDPVMHSTDVSMFADLGVPDIGILQAPYLAETWEQMEKVFASDWWKGQEKLLEEKGFKVLASNWRYGDRHTLTTKLVKEPKDMVGLKIRVPQSLIFVKAFEALGASATPLALAEVYTSLQQGVIDGQENPLATIYGGKFHEVAKFLALDAHMKTINIMVCGTAFWDTLTPTQQDLIQRTAIEAGDYQNKLLAASEGEILEQMKAQGVTVTEVDHQQFKKAVEHFYDYPEFSNWSPGLPELINKIMNE